MSPRHPARPLGFNVIHLDPYTGSVLGTRELGAARFEREHTIAFRYRLHYTLALPEPWGRWLALSKVLPWTACAADCRATVGGR